MNADAILADVTHYFCRTLGRHTVREHSPFMYQALARAVRDRLIEGWNHTTLAIVQVHSRRVSHLSFEF